MPAQSSAITVTASSSMALPVSVRMNVLRGGVSDPGPRGAVYRSHALPPRQSPRATPRSQG